MPTLRHRMNTEITAAQARFVNGEMSITLPKREESKPRSVKVKVATS